MNRLLLNGSPSKLPFVATNPFKDFGTEPCWAGPNPVRPGWCFGSDDGRLWLTDEKGMPIIKEPAKGSRSGEAVNGVVGIGRNLAVTTRQEVTFWKFDREPASEAIFPYGAHGITTTSSGFFVAPLGHVGLMVLQAGKEPATPVILSQAVKDGLVFYRAISVRGNQGQETLACACRLGGLVATEFTGQQDTHHFRSIRYDGLDIVDLCRIDAGPDSRAIAALARDGTLILLQDVLEDKNPTAIKFDGVGGTAYCLLSCRGHLFLLTSRAIYILGNLASRFIKGMPLEGVSTPVHVLPLEAVDANLYFDQKLFVVMPDVVRIYDIGTIHDSLLESRSGGAFVESQPRSVAPSWKCDSFEQLSQPLPALV